MTSEETNRTLIRVAQELGTAQMMCLNVLADEDVHDPELIEAIVIEALLMLLEEIDGPVNDAARAMRGQLLAAVVRYLGADE
jgi:hypothetical protein